MAENGRVHPDCSNSANPYHECGVACLEKIAEAKGRKDKKKSDKQSGIKEGELIENGIGERKVHPACSKASNPYHECHDYCYKRINGANASGPEKESGSKLLSLSGSFGRKKKETESQPKSPKTQDNGHAAGAVNAVPPQSPASHIPLKKNASSENSASFSSSSGQHSEEISSRDHSFNKVQGQPAVSLPVSGNKTPDHSKLPLKDSTSTIGNLSDEKRRSLAQIFSFGSTEEIEDGTTSPLDRSMNFRFSGVGQIPAESDDEIQSVISDSCVPVGKHHVRASVAPILQSIVNKYGDIAANCHLQSVSMRAYYLECLCSVVQELQSTPITQLTKGKVKEMLAVLKDVESAQIDVTWLRSVLNEVSEIIDVISQYHALEAAKANCNGVVESTRKELESQMEDLAQKEQAVEQAKAQVKETKARMSELELEYFQLNNTISSVRSKVDKYEGKSAAEGLL